MQTSKCVIHVKDVNAFLSHYCRMVPFHEQVKNMIKGTSLSFGNEPTVYRSMAADQMDIHVPEEEARGSQLEKNRLLKVHIETYVDEEGPSSHHLIPYSVQFAPIFPLSSVRVLVCLLIHYGTLSTPTLSRDETVISRDRPIAPPCYRPEVHAGHGRGLCS